MPLPKVTISIATLLLCFFAIGQNLSVYRSAYSVEETCFRLVDLIKKDGLVYYKTDVYEYKVSGEIDSILTTKVILFEETELVSQLISCRQTTALELPLKILVWEENKDVYLGFMSPELMRKSYLIKNCDVVIDDLSRLLTRLVNKVIRSS